MIFDLHVHSAISACSVLTLEEILYHARGKGLDGVCITDHDTMDARFEISDGFQDDGLLVIVGMEYETTEGDFLLFGDYEYLQPGLGARELLGLVAETGGAAVAAHPCRVGRAVAPDIIEDGLPTCVEVYNGRNSREENLAAARMLKLSNLPAVGGSDAHTLEEFGRVTTTLHTPVTSRAEFVTALRRGLCSPTRTHRTAPETRTHTQCAAWTQPT